MNRKAFTLIELLVVIAIIAILASILFPVFAQAKLAAKKTACLSNQKQASLGLLMYSGDSDDMFPIAEYGDDSSANLPHITWTTEVYPYVKNGDQLVDPVGKNTVSTGKAGVFLDPGAPTLDQKSVGVEGYYFGVNRLICAADYNGGETWFNGNGQVLNSLTSSQIDAPSDKVVMAEKGLNSSNDGWNYPWFVDWQLQYIDSIATTPGNAATVYRDGDRSQDPSWSLYTPWFNTDCINGVSDGKWECAAHPRYRYAGNTVLSYTDGHAKTMTKGGLKWFKNIYVSRGDITSSNWTYGWYYPGEPF